MLETPLRQAATVLLDSAIRIAPPEAREWGHAMRGELTYVQGPWATLMWGLGGASVMAKHALISLLMPGHQGLVPGDELFAKKIPLRKVALAGGAGCVLASLLFFAAPPFRQAFQVALNPWRFMFREIANRNPQAGVEAIAKRAEAQRDFEGMAFCAVRLWDGREAARLTEEAVRLNPDLLWVYAVVGSRHPGLPETGQWVEKLERWDPQNALFPLIRAQAIERAEFHPGGWWRPTQEQRQAWQDAMAAAFQSPRFDDYLDRVAQINRRVVARYRYYDPYEVESRQAFGLHADAFESAQRYAMSLLQLGAELEARGDRKGAGEKCWSVARFGQVVDSQGHTALEHWAGTSLQAMAYKQLQASFQKENNQAEAALFGYLAAKFDPVRGEHAGLPRESAFGSYVASRNAAVVQLSGLMILVFAGLLVAATTILIVGSRQGASVSPSVDGSSKQRKAQRAKPVATLVVLSSAAGLLFSCVTLYLTYRPYWYIFQTAIQTGSSSQTSDFHLFLMATQTPPGVPARFIPLLLDSLFYAGSPGFLFYVWTAVTLLGVIGLAVILLRHLRTHGPANRLQHHSRVQ